MKSRIFDRFTDNNKWKDYINLKAFECKMALFFAIVFLLFSLFVDIHENFAVYISVLRNVSLYIAQALIGVIGIIIAGVTIIFSVLNKEMVKRIEKVSNKSVQNLVVSFEFLAFNVGLGIFLFFIVHFSLYANFSLVNKGIFNIIIAFCSYFFFFIIFYSISLISNIVRIFYITNLYGEINITDKNIHVKANEIRIDYMLQTLLSITKVGKEEFLKSLDDYVDGSNVKEKEEIKKYFQRYYDGE